MRLEQRLQNPIFQVDEMTGEPEVRNTAIEFIYNASKSIHPPRFCWAVKRYGYQVLLCTIGNIKHATKQLQSFQERSRNPDKYRLRHLNKGETYTCTSDWGRMEFSSPTTHGPVSENENAPADGRKCED